LADLARIIGEKVEEGEQKVTVIHFSKPLLCIADFYTWKSANANNFIPLNKIPFLQNAVFFTECCLFHSIVFA
jgi:hypothetical protein